MRQKLPDPFSRLLVGGVWARDYYIIRWESDAALDATAAIQGKQSAAITSIHDGKHKY